MLEMLGVVNDAPVPRELPPVDAAYQLIVPPLAVAPKVNVPASQRASGVVPVIVGANPIVAVTNVLTEVQLFLVTST